MRILKILVLVLVTGFVFTGIQCLAQEQPAVKLPLAGATPLPIKDFTMAQLLAKYPPPEHDPIATSGVNFLSLPFMYESADGNGDKAEAETFAFLLSSSLDWAAGSFCARHAFFVFRRDSKVPTLRKQYNPKVIADMIEDWEATHAIGGKIFHSAKGYTGQLLIYDPAGNIVLDKKYDKPCDYFQLLGDMAVDGLIFSGDNPNQALKDHLHVKRCSMESVHLLGRASLMESKEEELSIYQKTIELDPKFADLRYWWANQKQWTDDDRDFYKKQCVQSLNDYLTENAFSEITDSRLPEAAVPEALKWIDEAQRLLGPDHPAVLGARLKVANSTKTVSLELLQKCESVAPKYPNCRRFIGAIAEAYSSGLHDAFNGARFHMISMQDRYMDGVGYKSCLYALAGTMGAYDLQTGEYFNRILLKIEKNRKSVHTEFWAYTHALMLADMGHYSSAAKAYRIAYLVSEEGSKERRQALILQGIAAAKDGDLRLLKRIMSQHAEEIASTPGGYLLQVYLDVLEGRPVDPATVASQKPGNIIPALDYEFLILQIQLDILAGNTKYLKPLREQIAGNPTSRKWWTLYHAYQQYAPDANAADFYEQLAWLHPNDPLAQQMIDEHKTYKAHTQPARMTPEQVLAALAEYEPKEFVKITPTKEQQADAKKLLRSLPPFVVEATIARLIDSGDCDRAKELALRYKTLAWHIPSMQRFYTTHLTQMVERARQQAMIDRAKRNL